MNSSKILSITEDTIKNMHKPFSGTDEYRTEPLKNAGSGSTGAAPEDIPRLMGHLADQISSSQFTLTPAELAAMASKRLTDIQPFASDNERTADALKYFILKHYDCNTETDIETLFSDSIIL